MPPGEGPERKQWQVPAYGAPKSNVFTWAKQQVDDGTAYWEANPGYQQLEDSIRILSGQSDDKVTAKGKDGKYSRLHTNRLKRNLREMVNALADVRFTPGFHSDNNELQDTARTINKVASSWYVDRFIDRKIKGGIQWMAISPCGWLEIGFKQILGERNKREIDVTPRSAFDVVMTGVPEDGDHQGAYTVTIIKDLPVFQAHALFPNDQDKLTPDRESPRGWREKIKDVFDQVFAEGPEKSTAQNPTVRIFYQYVLDLSHNTSGKTMKMGYEKGKDATGKETDVETPWSYDVPFVGQMIKAGYDDSGIPVFRPAELKDCRIFPGRRLIIFTQKYTIYDGPMFDWHGKVPLVKLCADQWPFAEFSMVHDVSSIHETIQEMERIAHQTARNRFWPTLLYNLKSIAREKAKALRTDISGQRIGFNPGEGNDPVKPLLPYNFYEINDWFQAFVKDLREQEDYQMGVKDISAMAKMRVGANSDSMEKMLEMAGPIVKGISRDMERAMRDLAEMFKFLVFQYYTTPRILQIVGPDGVTPTNFDWDPGNLIPSHLPGENKGKDSIYTRMQRAHYIADHVKFFVTPNSMHEIVQTSQRLMYLQMFRMGFPISWWDLARVMNLPNFGKEPDGTNDMLSRYFAQKKMELEFQASLTAEAQGLAAGAQGGTPSNTPGTGPRGGSKGGGGRAPSGQAPPALAAKGDGRPYVRESQ